MEKKVCINKIDSKEDKEVMFCAGGVGTKQKQSLCPL